MRHFPALQSGCARLTLALLATCLPAFTGSAQGTFKSAPATDAAAQASPLKPSPAAPATDSSLSASPLLGADPHPAPPLPGGITLQVRLEQPADSGSLHNGQTLRGTLIRSEGGALEPYTGTAAPVQLTVVGSVPAGRVTAAGELSLAVTQIGRQTVFSDILTFRGTPGHQDLPDSAPAVGTNAGLPAGTTLTFHSQGTPRPAGDAGGATSQGTPGSVSGTSNGTAAAQRPAAGKP